MYNIIRSDLRSLEDKVRLAEICAALNVNLDAFKDLVGYDIIFDAIMVL